MLGENEMRSLDLPLGQGQRVFGRVEGSSSKKGPLWINLLRLPPGTRSAPEWRNVVAEVGVKPDGTFEIPDLDRGHYVLGIQEGRHIKEIQEVAVADQDVEVEIRIEEGTTDN